MKVCLCWRIFISQGTIGSKLSELAWELSKIIDGEKYRIFFKLHPGEFSVAAERYRDLYKTDVVVISDDRYSLYDYFATSSVQVGVYSTAVFEGLGFGLDTYIYKIEMSGNMKELVDAGYVKYVKDSLELKNNIKISKFESNTQENFWVFNSIGRMKSEIKKML